MDESLIFEALAKMRDGSRERKFTQTVDFIINFKDLDTKKAENRVDITVVTPHPAGKSTELKPLVFLRDKSFAASLKGKYDFVMEEQIATMGKKQVAELVAKYTSFFAEGAVMLTVAKYLGQELAPKGKMPKPIDAEIGALEKAVAGIGSGMRITNNKGKFMPVIHCAIGSERSKDEELAANAFAIYTAVVKVLPKKEHNVKSAYVKLTMGPAIKIAASRAKKVGKR